MRAFVRERVDTSKARLITDEYKGYMSSLSIRIGM